MSIRYFFVFIVLVTNGCVSDIPKNIAKMPVQSVSVVRVQQDVTQFTGIRIRWGGEIVTISNLQNTSRVEILGRELGSSGKPVLDGTPDGRFIAEIPGFLDPVDFQSGQRMTVSGHIEGLEFNKVGEYPYPYPVVLVEQYYRWPASDPEPYYDPYWGYPGPWWPYYRPYHHPYYW